MNKLYPLFIALILTSCGDSITGEGPIITKEIQLDNFDGIILKSSFDVNYKQEEDFRIGVKGHQNIIEKLQTKIDNKRNLVFDLASGNYRNIQLSIEVSSPNIQFAESNGSGSLHFLSEIITDRLQLKVDGSGSIYSKVGMKVNRDLNLVANGSGNIKALNLEVKKTKIRNSGSSKVIASGITSELEIKNGGSGKIEAYDLISNHCIARAGGSGNIEVRGDSILDLAISGSGSIKYKGRGHLDSKTSGSGRIINAN